MTTEEMDLYFAARLAFVDLPDVRICTLRMLERDATRVTAYDDPDACRAERRNIEYVRGDLSRYLLEAAGSCGWRSGVATRMAYELRWAWNERHRGREGAA